jgi:hypothetical protein
MPSLPILPCLAATDGVKHRVSSALVEGFSQWWQMPLLIAALVAVTAPQATERVLDWGRQTAGVCRLCFAPVPAGTRLNVRYGELLYRNGSVNGLTSVAGQVKGGNGGPCAPQVAFAEDHYVFRGDGHGGAAGGAGGGSVSDAGGGVPLGAVSAHQ